MQIKIISKVSALLLTITFFLFAGATKVSAASFWLNPQSGTFSQGQNVSIGIGVNTGGESVNAVQANLTYAADKFDFVSLSTGGSALTIVAEKSGGGGQIRIGGGTPSPGFSGSKLIATVTLKAKVNSGSTQVSFNGDSSILRNSDSQNIKTGNTVGVFNFQQAVVVTPAPPLATNKPTPAAQASIQPTFNPIGMPIIPTAAPAATPTSHFPDNISTPLLYGIVVFSLIGALACLLYLIFTRNKI